MVHGSDTRYMTYLSNRSVGANCNGHRADLLAQPDSSWVSAEYGSFGIEVHSPAYINTSLESTKKDIENIGSMMSIVKEGQIYSFRYKNQEEKSQKNFGFVIPDKGGKYITPSEVLSQDRKGINTYSMTSILWKAVQELIEKIEKMEENNGRDNS